jgi:ATP-dependent Clp protease protease subunit
MNYYKNLDDRILWIDTDIDESLLEQARQIMIWNKEDKGLLVEDRKPIKIFIFSFGGDLHTCFTLLDIFQISKTPIYTINMGVAMSAGLILLLGGHKRYCLQRSQSLIHSGSGQQGGTYEQIQAQSLIHKKLIEMMRNYILERTKIDLKLYNKKKSEDWYLFADEQISLGICDEILTDFDII